MHIPLCLMAGIYIHIPFCKQACYYCDFHFSVNRNNTDVLVGALLKEIELQKNYLNRERVETIYFGGGTPSLLNKTALTSILTTVYDSFCIDNDAEITLEANPDDLSIEKLTELKQTGINRLSIGVQSFDDSVLSYLNRTHNHITSVTCINNARKVGFTNINIDLIYGIPNKTIDAWEHDIDEALLLLPEHLSCYSLTIEPKTVFGKWEKQGKLKAVSDDIAAVHFELLMDKLERAGYEHYEISNFSKPGFRSRHNSAYWNNQYYLGVGPSAHSYNGTSRQYNVSNNHLYIQSIEKDVVPYSQEYLTKNDKINEYLLTSLRTSTGCDTQFLRSSYGYDLTHQHSNYIQELFERGLAIKKDYYIVLTKKGRLLADKITSDLFVSI